METRALYDVGDNMETVEEYKILYGKNNDTKKRI